MMAATNVMRRDENLLMPSPLDHHRGDTSASRGLTLEKKIEALESLTGQVSNRRSRRWLNDRILMELVPRLDAQEIRGLFAPPPWGDDVPPSAFSLTSVEEWDKFRNIDMDKEANIMDSLNRSSVRQKGRVEADKTAVLNAWRRIDCRTREALRRSFLPELIEGYENCISHFIEEGGEGDVLELKVQDPFHRLLLHGVCEYHNLVSTTATEQVGRIATKTTRIKWKNGGDSGEKPSISLAHFLRMSKEGACNICEFWSWSNKNGEQKANEEYFVVDAFAESAFKGNPAAVCFLDDNNERDDDWLQSLAAEFNISVTFFLTPITVSDDLDFPRFRLRWFTPVTEVDLCGHATLASAHILLNNLVDSQVVEFTTVSGILTAKRVPLTSEHKDESTLLIELNFPVVPTCEINSVDDVSVFSKALNGATIVDVKATKNDILVVLSSWESVIELQPRIDEILKCPCERLMVTAAASAGSSYDFCSLYFAPKAGINEDPVTGSAHCALAHYWNLKMNKCDFVAYQASSRGGTVKVHLDKDNQRVLLRGKAITVMEGCVLV